MLIAVLDKPAVRPLKGVLHRTYRRRTRTLERTFIFRVVLLYLLRIFLATIDPALPAEKLFGYNRSRST
jgi:hypothetical protein